ncbi:Fc.00g095510.m01.CDS01 [Cosmosporella sp. VM-42]
MKIQNSLSFSALLPGILAAAVANVSSSYPFTMATCSDQYINDAAAPVADRWAAADAAQGFTISSLTWMVEQAKAEPSKLSYSEYISNYFNSKDLMVCQNMADGPCESTVTCNQVKYPAGFLILNSFVALHVMRKNVYEGLQDAMNQMQNKMSIFQSTFAPAATAKSTTWITDLLNVFQFVMGVGSAWTWNVAIKSANIFKDTNYLSFAKDSTNAAINMGFNIGKAHVPAASEIQNDLTLAMGTLFESWIDAELEFLEGIFSGDIGNLTVLEGLIKSGMALDITRSLNLGDFVNEAQRIIYAKLLPSAWADASQEVEDWPKSMKPMIMMVSDDCVTSGDGLPHYVREEDAAKMSVCHDGHTFFIGYPTFSGVPKSSSITSLKLSPLPGGTTDELNGSNWNGVLLDDLVVSAYEGWRLNGGKNGYVLPENSKVIDGYGTEGELIFENGIRTPGFISIPLCTPLRMQKTAQTYWDIKNQRISSAGFQGLPCGDGSLYVNEKSDWGF